MVLAAVGQICSTSSLTHNLAQCQNLAAKAAAAGAKALFLPEASDYIALNANESLSLAQPLSTSPFVLGLRSSAKQYALAINVGVHEPSHTPSPIDPSSPQTKLLNTLLWIAPTGEITQTYSKLHLFDVDLRPTGPLLRESDSVLPGNALTSPFTCPSLLPPTSQTETPTTSSLVPQIGLQICFDLRFPEPSLSLTRLGANILVYPSAFTIPTASAGHWETLLTARAIESQSWVIASAQYGRHNRVRKSWGESLVIGPWGDVRARLRRFEPKNAEETAAAAAAEYEPEPELWIGEIDMSQVEKVRREMPLKRRWDIYPQV
ncbi:putative nitrilase [Phaeomoniella chlamydospora]|uniref:Putative nitrilase n=1 Tax=Phaeomoniella chlamydospora TaxID=158046 RepID=A0A0G2ERW3_PHACM|nr:putative nitrilase [Phaeomoniella chlamydospora]